MAERVARRNRRLTCASSIARAAGEVALRVVPAAFIAAFFVWPVIALVRRAVEESGSSGGGVWHLLAETDAAHLLLVTLGQAAASTLCALLAAAPIVWLFARVDGVPATVLMVVVTVPFVLPTVVVGIAFRAVFGGPLNFLGIGTGLGAVLVAHTFLNVAVVVRIVGAAWRSLDPRVVDAARALGAARPRAFLSVVLPRLGPSVAAAATLVFLFCSTSFGVIIILGGGTLRTLETEIYMQAIGYFRIPEAVVLSMLQIVVVVVALIISRVVAGGVDAGAGGVYERSREHRSAFTTAAMIAAAAWAAVLLVGPILVLALRSVRPDSSGRWTLAGYRALNTSVNGVTPLETLRYSITTAVAAMVLAVVIGLLAALALHRSRGVVAAVGGILAMVPLGISAVTLGFGYLLILATMPYRIAASPWVIPCVQALIAIPLVIRIMLPALASIPPRLRAAAATLGAGPIRVFVDVDLPIIGRSLGAAAGFAFVMAIGEFGATTFLARANTTTLPVLIGSALNRPGAENFATAMAASMVMVAVTTAAVLAIELFRPRTGGL